MQQITDNSKGLLATRKGNECQKIIPDSRANNQEQEGK